MKLAHLYFYKSSSSLIPAVILEINFFFFPQKTFEKHYCYLITAISLFNPQMINIRVEMVVAAKQETSLREKFEPL